jgi:hypothetical protein
MQFTYPTSQRIMEIEQDKLPDLKGDDPIFAHFPEQNQDEWAILIEQWDNIAGMQQHRGLNNAPPRVRPIGLRRTIVEPGVYGEHILIDERALSTRRRPGTFGTPANVTDLVLTASDQLASREFTRMRYLMWTLLQTGSYAAIDQYSVVGHQLQFTPQTYTAAHAWSDPVNSTPLQDMRNVADLGALGTSAMFNANATAYLNQSTYNRMLANTNQADLGGRRTEGLGTFNAPDKLNQMFVADDLPRFQVLQDGFFDETTQAFQRYINTGKVVVIGKRTSGDSLGMLVMVPNVNNPTGASGRYVRTVNKDIDAMGPRSIEVHRGFNGTVYVKFPRAVYVLNV